MRSLQKGITLVELIIVIAVIAIMIGIALAFIDPRQQLLKARDADKKNTIKNLGVATQSYYTMRSIYPNEADWDQQLVLSGSIKQFPNNPSASPGCNENLKPGPTTGFCFVTYSDPTSGKTEALIYAVSEAKSELSKCASSTSYYVWASLLGTSGIHCYTGTDMITSFTNNPAFISN